MDKAHAEWTARPSRSAPLRRRLTRRVPRFALASSGGGPAQARLLAAEPLSPLVERERRRRVRAIQRGVPHTHHRAAAGSRRKVVGRGTLQIGREAGVAVLPCAEAN